MSVTIDRELELEREIAATPLAGLVEDAPPTAGVDESRAAPPPMTQKRVLGLATPIIGENLLHTMVGAVDTFLVARLGAAAVAGVGIGFEFVFFIISILSAIDIGATVLVAQSIGAGDKERANRLARQAIVWGLLLAIPVSVLMYRAAPTIVGLFGAEPEVTAAGIAYLEVIAATAVALFLSFVCGAVLRGAGDSRTPLVAATIANVINVAVAYTLIQGKFGFPALGVAGSAWGAAAGRAIGATFMLAMMVSGRRAVSLRGSWGWRPQPAVARQIFSLGIPAALEQMLSSGAFLTLVAVVALIGTPALAAQQIAFTALSTAFLPGIAFSIAATALVGQSFGARVPGDARKAWNISLRWAMVWLGIGGAIVFFFGGRLMGIFSNDPAVIANGEGALRALGVALPFWAVWFVSAGSLRGSGDTRTPLIIGASSMWLAVGLAWVGIRFFDAPFAWVWVAFGLVTTPAAILMWFIFRQRIGEYESGERPLPTVDPAMAH
jgi:putative MATE family efflux protein